MRTGFDAQIWALPDRLQIGNGGADPASALDGAIRWAETLGLGAIVVVAIGKARLQCGVQPGLLRGIGDPGLSHRQRAVAAVKRGLTVLVVLGALEIWQHLRIRPA